ncbi:MAG: heavy-metal-associated domain-containing protein [Anaerolineales bacterium]|nr:heavy-metal-associated domain-containing protein [Anaerolineales bacterium]
MERLVMNIPALYGDHHTTAVRKLLEPMDGVAEILASSAAHQLVVKYYPTVVTQAEIVKALENQGYVAGAPEPAFALPLGERSGRHTAILSGTGESMAFAEQSPTLQGRALWPCPGFEIQHIPKE